MRDADLTHGRCGRDLRPGDERWRPLAQHLAERFAATGDSDDGMIEVAVATIRDAEERFGAGLPDFSSLVVPLVISALRRHRRECIRRRPASAPELELAIASAESVLSRRLRRSPTVAEVATYLDMAQHRIIAGLEAAWSACAPVVAFR